MHGRTALGRKPKGMAEDMRAPWVSGTAGPTLATLCLVVTPLLLMEAPLCLVVAPLCSVAAQVNVLRVEAPPSIGPLCREINAHVGAANVRDTNTIHAPFLEGVHRHVSEHIGSADLFIHRHV